MALSDAQQALAEGALLIGELFGLGGDQWTVSAAATGDGVSGPTGPAELGTWTGRVKRSRATQAQDLAARVSRPVTEWHAIGSDATVAPLDPDDEPLTLQVNHILTSMANPTLRFLVKDPHVVAGYVRFILEEL